MVKLQKQLGTKYKDKTYTKFCIVIPNKTIKELNWEHSTELVTYVCGEKLIIEQLNKEGEN